jgi:ArsR family transcriptional regulator
MKKTTALLKALAHETRLQILSLLIDGEVCVCKIMDKLELPQSTVSRHLAILKSAGLLEDRRDGTWIHYSLAAGHAVMVAQLLGLFGEHPPQTEQSPGDQQKLPGGLRKKNCA